MLKRKRKKKSRLLFGKKCTIGDICVWAKVAGGGSDFVQAASEFPSEYNE